MRFILLLLSVSIFNPALAWKGYDSENGSHIEFTQKSTFHAGDKNTLYDSKTKQEHPVTIKQFKVIWGGSSEVTVYDEQLKKERVLWMEDWE